MLYKDEGKLCVTPQDDVSSSHIIVSFVILIVVKWRFADCEFGMVCWTHDCTRDWFAAVIIEHPTQVTVATLKPRHHKTKASLSSYPLSRLIMFV